MHTQQSSATSDRWTSSGASTSQQQQQQQQPEVGNNHGQADEAGWWRRPDPATTVHNEPVRVYALPDPASCACLLMSVVFLVNAETRSRSLAAYHAVTALKITTAQVHTWPVFCSIESCDVAEVCFIAGASATARGRDWSASAAPSAGHPASSKGACARPAALGAAPAARAASTAGRNLPCCAAHKLGGTVCPWSV